MAFSDKVYQTLKWIALYLLPALGTLYFALSSIWGFPYGEQVVGTITAIDAFLGALLGISTANYKGDGQMIVNTEDPEKDVYRLELEDLASLSDKKSITLKIVNEDDK